MEVDKDEKICASTYECFRSFKILSYISFKDLDDLKAQLKTEGYVSVGLVEFGHYDDYGKRIKSEIKIDNIEMTHIEWCVKASRYLELYRH